MDRFFAFTRVFFGWDWFVGVPDHHDNRRRTTKALATFTKFARGAALGNALALAHGHLSFANAIGHFLPESLSFVFPPELDNVWAMVHFKTWIQAQLLIQTLAQIHKRLLRIANAEH